MHRCRTVETTRCLAEGEMPTDGPTYERIERPAGRTLVVHGELDLATVDELREQLSAVILEAHSPAYVDLSGVTFFDSSSIAVLVEAHRLAPAHGSELVIVAPSPACRRVIDILGLDDVLDIRAQPSGR